MAYISPKAFRTQNKKLAETINGLFNQVNLRRDSYVLFTPYVGNLYNVVAYSQSSQKVIKFTELQLEFNPLEVNLSSSQKQLKKLTGVSEIVKQGNGYKFIP